ncbi:STAS domain-containing protein [Blastococcus sp. TF02A-26]|uniref:STAS domain-containing protein n=1 Tax=Blastococcus sp. TF02A-26 TaxID=2250577 RepID=UPI0013147436|nr:STAS domain-containing protein [Blastococcus sp. TF02A-26]
MTATRTGTITPDLLSVTSSAGGRITAVGEIDCSTAPRLATCLDSVLAAAPAEVVVDLSQVTFLDSAGLHTLVTAHGRATGLGVRLRVLVATRAVLRPIQVTGLEHVLGIEHVQPADDSGVGAA